MNGLICYYTSNSKVALSLNGKEQSDDTMPTQSRIKIISLIAFCLVGCQRHLLYPTRPSVELRIERQFGSIQVNLYNLGVANVRFARAVPDKPDASSEQSYWIPCEAESVKRIIPYLVAMSRTHSSEKQRPSIEGVRFKYSLITQADGKSYQVNGRVIELTTNDLLDGMVREIESIAQAGLAESLFWRSEGDTASAVSSLLDWRTHFKRRYADHFDWGDLSVAAQQANEAGANGPPATNESRSAIGFPNIPIHLLHSYDQDIALVLSVRRLGNDYVVTFTPSFAHSAGDNFRPAIEDEELSGLTN